MKEEEKRKFLKAQQGELDGVETYLLLAKTVHNESDAAAFKTLAADEGRHASVFRKITGETLKPNKFQAYAVTALYHILGKRILYPLIARFEYSAIPGYEEMIADYPEVASVKDDEKRHGDTLHALLMNGEFNDKPKLPILLGAIIAGILIWKLLKLRSEKQEALQEDESRRPVEFIPSLVRGALSLLPVIRNMVKSAIEGSAQNSR